MAKGKYKEWLTDDSITRLQGWARDGLTDVQIANNIGIDPATLYTWKNKYDKIDNALKRGKEVIDMEVENSLLKRALGYEYEEVKQIIEKDGNGKERKKIEKTNKTVLPDVTAMIFWLKNRKPKEWRDKQEYEHSGGLSIKVEWTDDDS